MRNNIIITIICAILLFSSCKKDNDIVVFSLETSNYLSQDKTHIDTANNVYYTCWDEGDQIKINGAIAAVSAQNTTVTVNRSDDYYAIYPASSVGGEVTNTTTITLPKIYEYSTDDNGFQLLKAPMAAKAVSGPNGRILFFKNLCTLLKIHVTGNINVHNINIHSSTTALSGSATVSIAGPKENEISIGGVTGEKYVSLHFPSGCLTPSSGKDFFIPVPALPNGETLHIAVVATIISNGNKNVYMRSTTTIQALPANMVIPMNVFPTIGDYQVGTCVTYLMGNRKTDNGSYIRPYINTLVHANQGTTIEMSLSPENDQIPLETYTPFIYGQNGGPNAGVMFYLWKAPNSSTTSDIVQTGTKRDNPAANFLCATADLTDRYFISHSPNSFSIKNITKGTTWEHSHNGTPATYTSVDPIYLMWAVGDNNNRKFMGKCHYFRVTDGSGKVFDGIPVTVPVAKFDQFLDMNIAHGNTANEGVVPCMYDLVSGEFFSSETAGVHFKYGTAVIGGNN